MTLSTPAEHKAARDADRLADALEERIRPTVTAEEFVFALEGTEDDPAVIDAEAEADELCEDVFQEARKTAVDWGEGHVADSVAEALADRAGGLALEMLREAPTVEDKA